ncbi:MAG: hypothetical protein C7B45_14845 [Sulfobacillus acidophilus]|uniref:HTH rpiR-type domain-containing protein n=1 Tax=Sulfobacillus acidophilus TaxID=53633 RepID=A0A2T2WDY5_9FIRM|nr:MAG: hypothetical protein C7B45_14845 [Sulfobacillus acidophilus]
MKISDFQMQFEQASVQAPPAVQRALVWLAQHTPEIAWQRVDAIARHAGVSPASVVRAVQRAGFEGFVDLQAQIRALDPVIPPAWQTVATTPDVTTSVLAQEIANLTELEPTLRAQIDVITDWLLSRQHLIVTASLMTASLAEHVALNFRYLLGGVDFVDAASSQAWMLLRDLHDEDGVVGISYPRYSTRTSAFLGQCAKRTPHILWITDLGGPSIPAELVLRLPSTSQSHYSSTVALMALIQVLAHELAEREPQRIRRNIEAADAVWRILHEP